MFCRPVNASAQAVTGTLLGNITDSSGAAVPGATVTATETQTNVSRSAVTNEAGYYMFSSLQNGTYAVEAELQGFKKVVRQGVKLDVNTTVRVDLRLEVGQLNETVTVSRGDAAAADRPDRYRPHHRIEDGVGAAAHVQSQLPVPAHHRARARRDRTASTRQFFNSQDSLAVEVNGQPRMANNTLIEGLDNNHKTGLLQVIIPAADALETVNVTTSNYDAEFGRSGGAITNVTIKSGTNDLKGSAFFFGNTDATNASDYFTHLKAPTKFANGGFTLGGPIVRNKLFFFGDYQRTHRQRAATSCAAMVPTLRMRQRRLQRSGHTASTTRSPATQRHGPDGVREQPDPAGADQPDRAAAARRSFRSRTSRRRSGRTTIRRPRRGRRRPTGSTRRSTTR